MARRDDGNSVSFPSAVSSQVDGPETRPGKVFAPHLPPPMKPSRLPCASLLALASATVLSAVPLTGISTREAWRLSHPGPRVAVMRIESSASPPGMHPRAPSLQQDWSDGGFSPCTTVTSAKAWPVYEGLNSPSAVLRTRDEHTLAVHGSGSDTSRVSSLAHP